MQRANSIALYIGIPAVVFQFTIYSGLHSGEDLETTGSFLVFLAFVLTGVVVHEFIHGLTWMAFGGKPLSTIKFGFQWKTFTPYAHLSEPIEVNAYNTSLNPWAPGLNTDALPASVTTARAVSPSTVTGMIKISRAAIFIS